MNPTLNSKAVSLNLILLKNVPIFQQLQLEEALLRADNRNFCLLNYGSPPAIVMGISGNPEQLLNQGKLAFRPVPVIRRFSGGGTVFIDPQTIFMTWICNASDSNVACCPLKLYQWTSLFYQKAFPKLNIELLENDYVIGSHKFGGNAQYLCKGRWLHHTSFLWDYDSDNMQYLQIPSKMPKYRENRSHHDFLCRLKSYFKCQNTFLDELLKAVHESFYVEEPNVLVLDEILNRPHRKATIYCS